MHISNQVQRESLLFFSLCNLNSPNIKLLSKSIKVFNFSCHCLIPQAGIQTVCSGVSHRSTECLVIMVHFLDDVSLMALETPKRSCKFKYKVKVGCQRGKSCRDSVASRSGFELQHSHLPAE